MSSARRDGSTDAAGATDARNRVPTGKLLLSARALAFAYAGELRALEHVDLELRAGEFVVVIGPNGSGKSTLLKILAGLLEPSSGSVELDGRALATYARRDRARQVALVPQFLPALPEVRVDEFVLSGRYAQLGRWNHVGSSDVAAATEALADCDAADLSARDMTELSGGQRQRVLVARAIAQSASVVLVDEPTNALDPEHQIRVFDLLARQTCEERATIVVTHDLNLASQYATRLVLLDRGRVVADGTVERVLVREVLAPVYGEHLHYGRWPGEGARPYVLPRRHET